MKLVFDDCLGIKDTTFDVINVRHQIDANGYPIDIAVISFNKEDLEHIAFEFCEEGYNYREMELSDLHSAYGCGIPEELYKKVIEGTKVYEALYGRLTKFKVENPKGRVVYY